MQNKKALAVFCCLVFLPVLLGCARRNAIDTHYLNVDYTDRIDIDEAKTIAKKELLNQGQHYYYRLTAPHVVQDARTQKYPDLWFVSFDPKAVSKTTFGNYLVIVERETGNILFSNAYDPRLEKDFDWAMRNVHTTQQQ